ncbi:MAG: acyltransferase [Bacteroidota bacterium]
MYSSAAVLENLRFSIYNRKKNRGSNNRIIKGNQSIFRRVKISIYGKNNTLQIGSKCRFRKVVFDITGNNNTIRLGDGITFMEAGHFLIVGDNCTIEIGHSTLFRDGSLFAGESNTSIKVGENCFCGVVTISTSDFHSVLDLSTGERINKPDNIIIGNNNWINNSVSIRKGSVISNDSIIAPNALVNKKFLISNVIIGGQPAKVIREGIAWSREKL